MLHPYRGLPDYQYWRRTVESQDWLEIDPVTENENSLKLYPTTKVATAGSCFAQRIARSLMDQGYYYLKTETPPAGDEQNPMYGQFSAAYGNVYTVTQLYQLMRRAFGLFRPTVNYWTNSAGRFVDPFRPRICEEGFETVDELLALQESHLKAVRRVFEESEVFIFTLGLTEGWVAKADGAAIPVVPGAVDCPDSGDLYEFRNARVSEMVETMTNFLRDLRLVNPTVAVILTVSPVAMIATYENQNIILANTYSKASLRVVAEEMRQSHSFVSYFPGFEIVNSHASKGQFYEDDFRLVRPEGVAHVMEIFARHYLSQEKKHPVKKRKPIVIDKDQIERTRAEYEKVSGVICDEERLVSAG